MTTVVLRRIFLITLCLSSSACASYFKRKECEKTNWYKHGFDVAMRGQRLDADGFVKECKRVEADVRYSDLDTGFKAGMSKYCEPETVFNVGKSGKSFTWDMCDDGRLPRLKQRHAQGLRIFCRPDSGYRHGTAGGAYENVCTPEEEAAFLPEYRRGRKVYLNHVITEKEREIHEADEQILVLQRQLSEKNFQLARLPSGKTIERKRQVDPMTRKEVEQLNVREDEDTQRRREQLNWDINSINNNINGQMARKTRLREEIRALRTEMVAL